MLLLPSVRVLVVDDILDMRDLVTDILQEAGATVMVTDTAEHALELLTQWRPDVLVSDLEMPENDGCWLIEHVRALAPEGGGMTPAACLSGRSEPEHRARILRAGFQYHLVKPLDVTRLVGVVAILALKP
jgi:CheY-like chemotaxis protein